MFSCPLLLCSNNGPLPRNQQINEQVNGRNWETQAQSVRLQWSYNNLTLDNMIIAKDLVQGWAIDAFLA